jgi:2-oxoisovalerate dehydrogenase E1 component
MFATIPNPIPARMKGVNRAEVCDVNFSEFVKSWDGIPDAKPAPDEAILEGSALDARGFRDLFESQLISRHLDLMARVLRVQNKVFYTIGSSGHEGNAMVARAARHTDPAFLHYRSGGFMAERFRKLPGMDPIMDSALSFAASAEDPASGGRHKVWGSKPLWVLPQTSTIASHLPKALGTAVAIEPHAASATSCRFPMIPSRSVRSAMPRPTMPPRRPRSMPHRGRPTRSCRRRCCSSARTTASASR